MASKRLMALGVAVVAGAVGATAVAAFSTSSTAAAAEVMVYKSPTCGCCSKWVDHLRAAGFTVETQDMNDLSGIKAELGVTNALASCHTAVVGGYVIEGHVPADVVQRLLAEKPALAGLAVPGMPMGSPGMEGPRQDPYDILSFDLQGNTAVYDKR
jgi:hypothetical protein